MFPLIESFIKHFFCFHTTQHSDNFQVEIDDENGKGEDPSKQPSNRFYRPTVPTQVGSEKPKEVAKGLDLNQPGNINGTPVMAFDTGAVVDKPWLRPGLLYIYL